MEKMEGYLNERKGINYLSRHLQKRVKNAIIIVSSFTFVIGFILGAIIF